MLILVANLGSTSFKYRLFRMGGRDEALLAKGGYERVTDHGAAIDQCLAEASTPGARADCAGTGIQACLDYAQEK